MWLTAKQVAARLQVSEAVLRQWRRRGQGPPAVTVGGRLVRYDSECLDEWVRKQGATDDAS